MENIYPVIPKEKFEFANQGKHLHDEKLKTKSRSYFADAFLRFKKNKSSVVAACIIALLLLFAIIAPIVSPYSVYDKNDTYKNFPPYIPSIAEKEWGILDGSASRPNQNDLAYQSFIASSMETGLDVIISIDEVKTVTEIYRGKERQINTYNLTVNAYYEKGMIYKVFSYETFQDIMDWQDETGIQVIYPYVEQQDIYTFTSDKNKYPNPRNANIWYECTDVKGNVKKDADGNPIFTPAYSTNTAKEGMTYTSTRIEGDPGNYIYSYAKSGAVEARVCYYNYYQYLNGTEPTYLMGTDAYGRDLMCCIGMGARFSLIFAIIVSAINLTIGAFYGAAQGYYGGIIDMTLDRISDILSGVPFIVVTTLFQLHLAQKVGTLGAFIFAFVLTGWIGMAALTRKQFYRFKNSEYVMAARTLGASDGRLMFKHIFPNSLGTMVTSCALVIPGVISSETQLTYLKIINLADFSGTSIGELMALGQQTMTSSPHAMFFPALFVSLLLISFNLFGNGLRDAFNPSTRGVED